MAPLCGVLCFNINCDLEITSFVKYQWHTLSLAAMVLSDFRLQLTRSLSRLSSGLSEALVALPLQMLIIRPLIGYI